MQLRVKLVKNRSLTGQKFHIRVYFPSNGEVFLTSEKYANEGYALHKAEELAALLGVKLDEV